MRHREKAPLVLGFCDGRVQFRDLGDHCFVVVFTGRDFEVFCRVDGPDCQADAAKMVERLRTAIAEAVLCDRELRKQKRLPLERLAQKPVRTKLTHEERSLQAETRWASRCGMTLKEYREMKERRKAESCNSNPSR